MKRVPLTDGSGSWFDSEKAEMIEEATRHNGNNYISRATGSQWHHEALYRTAGGKWILNAWSDYQGSLESYVAISSVEAAAWLAKQGLDPDPGLDNPDPVVLSEYAKLEIL
jgi:hypothetical protein